ncbi:MAG: YdiU family protein, partial [Flavobacterium sp.]|nr:YdiU family protein [Pedobacter sp.]
AGQLGDGRAITLGEWETPGGETWELQLKGAGLTPYSRRGDGRAVLRSSVREYLMSEAMHYLGIPTTRALSLVSTGDQVMRDMFYNGQPAFEPGAIVLRASPSFLRFGSFEMLASRNETENLKALADWTISRYFPHIQGGDQVLKWFAEVVEKTATLIVEWQRVGFVHGVMNTDNMSVLGLTIDYGPFSFIDNYDPDFTPNTTDLPGKRYAFGQQASVAYWNLSCLANAISVIVSDSDQLVEKLKEFEIIYGTKYYTMMAGKIGLDQINEADVPLITLFETMMTSVQPDMTIFYQLLVELPMDLKGEINIARHFNLSFYHELTIEESKTLNTLIQTYQKRIQSNQISREDSLNKMRKSNPRFILRNYLLHLAIEELENGRDDLFIKLQQAMNDPYSKNHDEFFKIRPEWASQKAGCSMLSCSS